MLPLGGDAGPLGGDGGPLGGVGGLLEGLEDPERSVLLCVTPSALSLNLLSLKYISNLPIPGEKVSVRNKNKLKCRKYFNSSFLWQKDKYD